MRRACSFRLLILGATRRGQARQRALLGEEAAALRYLPQYAALPGPRGPPGRPGPEVSSDGGPPPIVRQ